MKDYSTEITNKNLWGVLAIFRSNLSEFTSEEENIFKDYNSTPEVETLKRFHLQYVFNQNWNTFIKDVPFPIYNESKTDYGRTTLRMSSVLPNSTLLTYNPKLADAIINTVIYIYAENNVYYSEIIIWRCLCLISQAFDITTMLINPKDIVNRIFKMMEEAHIKDYPKPSYTYYMGVLYDRVLSSSEKGYIYRQKMLNEPIGHFIMTHRLEYGYNPTRYDVRRFIIDYCKKSDDRRLKVFSEKINEKTLSKLLRGSENLLS